MNSNENDFDYTWVLDPNYHNKSQNYICLDSIFTDRECDLIIQYGLVKYRKNLYHAHVTGYYNSLGNLNTSIRESNVVMFPNNDEEIFWLFRKITDVINEVNRDYFGYDLNCIETLQFTNYDSSTQGFYKKHVDLTYGVLCRKLSFTIQLSDENSYEGGDFCFHTSPIPTILPKKRGTLICFPSFVLHEVTPITKGSRNSLVGWIVGPNFK
tara:strand:- start:117 stop:749 length:633 start_codon:yes stop_codon:yes gene_type:complete